MLGVYWAPQSDCGSSQEAISAPPPFRKITLERQGRLKLQMLGVSVLVPSGLSPRPTGTERDFLPFVSNLTDTPLVWGALESAFQLCQKDILFYKLAIYSSKTHKYFHLRSFY